MEDFGEFLTLENKIIYNNKVTPPELINTVLHESLHAIFADRLVDIISIDWKTNLQWVLENINRKIITQGNLDPVLLSSDNMLAIKNEVYRILNLTQERCHIFNVGHGLTPEVKIENVKYAIELIDNYS